MNPGRFFSELRRRNVFVSGVEENAYFSDGITEDIPTRLPALEGRRVISRTSAMPVRKDPRIPALLTEVQAELYPLYEKG